MGRNSIERSCCVCLNTGFYYNKLTSKDDNKISLLTKFRMCISEVIWLPSFYLCLECSVLLDSVHTFREQCLKSDRIRQRQNIIREQPLEAKEDNVEKGPENKLKEELKNDEMDRINGVSDLLESEVDNFDASDNEEESVKSESGGDLAIFQADTSISIADDQHVGKLVEIKPRKKRKRNFSCEKCSKIYQTSTKLISHCIRQHAMTRKDVKPFSCDRCPHSFLTSSNLWQHMKYHEGVKSSICTYCGKGFITKTDLINHEKKHLNMREYNCEFCGKSFNTHKDIRSHRLMVHTDTSLWKYMCEICTKPFPIKSNFDSHMRRHTGEKRFSCHLCDKKFTTKCDLQRHTKSHSDVREHQCPHCDREYKDERVLKVHMAKVHSVGLDKVKIPVRKRSYACHFCPKAYYAKNKLTRHLYTHSGEKPFSCPVCNKKFNDKSYVKQHLRNTHNIESQEPSEKPPKMSYLLVKREAQEIGPV